MEKNTHFNTCRYHSVARVSQRQLRFLVTQNSRAYKPLDGVGVKM